MDDTVGAIGTTGYVPTESEKYKEFERMWVDSYQADNSSTFHIALPTSWSAVRWNGVSRVRSAVNCRQEVIRRALFCESFRSPALMISHTLEVDKQMENKTTKGAHARFAPGALLSLQNLSFLPPARLISHLECDENGNKERHRLVFERLSRALISSGFVTIFNAEERHQRIATFCRCT